MARMKTFLTYALMIILFYLFSNFAISTMIRTSYRDVPKNNINIEQSDDGFEITVDRADSNKRQGYFTGTVKNTSDKVIEKKYVKVDSYYKGKLMQEKYLAFENLKPGEERKFKLLYNVGSIDEFKVSYVDKIPENRTKIDDAIDGVKSFADKMKKGTLYDNTLGKWFGNNSKGNNIKPGNIANRLYENFTPVSVQGNNLELFTAIMWVWYAIPAGAIWFIV